MEALSKWIGHIPGDVLQDMAHIAPMLARLGYDPYANPPHYGHPDPLVVNNTHRVSVTARSTAGRWRGGLVAVDLRALHPHSLLKGVKKKRVETRSSAPCGRSAVTPRRLAVTRGARSLAWLGPTALPVILWWGSFLCCGRY